MVRLQGGDIDHVMTTAFFGSGRGTEGLWRGGWNAELGYLKANLVCKVIGYQSGVQCQVWFSEKYTMSLKFVP